MKIEKRNLKKEEINNTTKEKQVGKIMEEIKKGRRNARNLEGKKMRKEKNEVRNK